MTPGIRFLCRMEEHDAKTRSFDTGSSEFVNNFMDLQMFAANFCLGWLPFQPDCFCSLFKCYARKNLSLWILLCYQI